MEHNLGYFGKWLARSFLPILFLFSFAAFADNAATPPITVALTTQEKTMPNTIASGARREFSFVVKNSDPQYNFPGTHLTLPNNLQGFISFDSTPTTSCLPQGTGGMTPYPYDTTFSSSNNTFAVSKGQPCTLDFLISGPVQINELNVSTSHGFGLLASLSSGDHVLFPSVDITVDPTEKPTLSPAATTTSPYILGNYLSVASTQQFTAVGSQANPLPDGSYWVLKSWNTSDSHMLTLSSTGLATVQGSGLAQVYATFAGGLTTPKTLVATGHGPIVSLAVSGPANSILSNDKTQKMTATGSYLDNTSASLTGLNWTVNPNIFSIDPTTDLIMPTLGTVGSASVSASYATPYATFLTNPKIQGTTKNPVVITHGNVTSFTLTPSSAQTLLSNASPLQFSANAVYQDTSAITNFTWASSNPAAGTISATGLFTPVLHAVGQTNVSASIPNTSLSKTVPVTVSHGNLSSVQAVPDAATIDPQKTQTFTANALYQDGSSFALTSGVTWTSSDQNVASMNTGPQDTGVAKGFKKGSTTITAAYDASVSSSAKRSLAGKLVDRVKKLATASASNNLSGTATLNVTDGTIASVSLTPTNPSALLPNGTIQFSALGTYQGGGTEDLTKNVTWASSNTSAATIGSSTGIATGVAGAGGTANISATYGSTPVTPSFIPLKVGAAPVVLKSIQIASTKTEIYPNYPSQFTATGTYSDGSTKDLTKSQLLSWTSSNPSVATVQTKGQAAPGLVTGVSVGTSNITAQAGNVTSNSVPLTVTHGVETVTLHPTNPSVLAGKTLAFSATGQYADGTSAGDLTKAVTWSSSNQGVATISNANPNQGLATGMGAGTASIGATYSGVANITPVNLTVTNPVTSVTLSTSKSSIFPGQTSQFTASGKYSDGTTQDLTKGVTWTSTNTGVATISNVNPTQGLATGMGAGTASIGATYSGVSNITPVNLIVAQSPLTSLTLSPSTLNLNAGQQQKLTATAHYQDGSAIDVTNAATWASSNSNVASVTGGMVTAGNTIAGKTTITASYAAGGASTSATASVGVSTLTLAPGPVTGNLRGFQAIDTDHPNVLFAWPTTQPAPNEPLSASQAFIATLHKPDGTSQDVTANVTWSSDNSVIYFSTNGLAKTNGMSCGLANITVTYNGLSASLPIDVSYLELETTELGATPVTLYTNSSPLPLSETWCLNNFHFSGGWNYTFSGNTGNSVIDIENNAIVPKGIGTTTLYASPNNYALPYTNGLQVTVIAPPQGSVSSHASVKKEGASLPKSLSKKKDTKDDAKKKGLKE